MADSERNGPSPAALARAMRALGLTRRGVAFSSQQKAELEHLTADLRSTVDGLAAEVRAALGTLSRRDGKAPGSIDVLAAYSADTPNAQTAVDIFEGEWASAFPPPLEDVRAGTIPLFEAENVTWGAEILGGVKGQRVLELGPLEGGHTYILDRLGAAEVVAVEANARAYLKCLISKELLDITSARFLFGDVVRYLERELSHGQALFDFCLASGVLYHMKDPVGLLDLVCRASDRLLLWTHYYDRGRIESRPELAVKFTGSTVREHDGLEYTLHRQEYRQALDYGGFCGGSAEFSNWMTRQDILDALDHFGFEVVGIDYEAEDHVNGPCFCVAARRR